MSNGTNNLGDFEGLDGDGKRGETAAAAPAWERRPEESSRSYAAFRRYLEAGDADRSLSKVARRLHVSKTLLGRWSAMYGWQERAREFDEDTAKLTLQTIQTRRVRLGLQQVEIAEKMFALVKKSLPRQRKLNAQDTARLFVAALRALEQLFGDEQPLATVTPKVQVICINKNQPRDFAAEEARGIVH